VVVSSQAWQYEGLELSAHVRAITQRWQAEGMRLLEIDNYGVFYSKSMI